MSSLHRNNHGLAPSPWFSWRCTSGSVPFWAWERSDWLDILCPSTNDFKVRHPHQNSLSRQLLFAGGYLLRLFDDFRNLGAIDRPALASRIFGRERVENAVLEVVAQIRSWGYAVTAAKEAQWTLCTLLLANGSPNLERPLGRSAEQREEHHNVSDTVVQASLFCQKRWQHWATFPTISRLPGAMATGGTPVPQRRGWHPNGSPGWTAGRRRQPCRSIVGSATT